MALARTDGEALEGRGTRSHIRTYLREAMEAFGPRPESLAEANQPARQVSEAIFSLLTSQRFGHLGRQKSLPYRSAVLERMASNVRQGEPVRFYYDLGPGYHASLRPGVLGRRFDVGLAELFAMRQVMLFCNAVGEVYAPGAKFCLVIDNLCGLFTNDAPLADSELYVSHLRGLLRELDIVDRVSLLVESEQFSVRDYQTLYDSIIDENLAAEITPAEQENVSRFMGGPCTIQEAAERMERYRRATSATETLLGGVVDGVRLTQRASPHTLGFRSFPGGDQRIQVGELALTESAKGGIKPVLLTSRNVGRFVLRVVDVADVLPPSIPAIRYADPRV